MIARPTTTADVAEPTLAPPRVLELETVREALDESAVPSDLPAAREEHLDPQDWTAFRGFAHRLLDRMLDVQQNVRREPVWRQMPAESERHFLEPPPLEGAGTEAAFDDFLTHVLPYPTGNLHPRFWGWVGGTGTPSTMLAELAGAAMNSVAGNFNDAASRVEAQVLGWMKSMLGFPATASGVLTSGGSVANLIGLAVGRDARLGHDVRGEGLDASPGRPVFYASTEVHSSVMKAAMMLGLGRRALRLIEVDPNYRIDVARLEARIERDRAAGRRPFAIVANAGTVNTGAIDDLEALADLAERENLWLHVDGAFGALAALAPELRPLVRGLERVDSIAFDFHKWMSVPYDAGCVLVRDAAEHRASFHVEASYLAPPPRGVAALVDPAHHRGLQLSRGFRALKVWLHVKEHGFAKLGRIVAQNVAQAHHLVALVHRHPELELLAPAPLNVVCFRYVSPDELPDMVLDGVNREILMRLQERGIATPSSTVLDGRFALRVANVNQRTRRHDFQLLVHEVVRLGREILTEPVPAIP